MKKTLIYSEEGMCERIKDQIRLTLTFRYLSHGKIINLLMMTINRQKQKYLDGGALGAPLPRKTVGNSSNLIGFFCFWFFFFNFRRTLGKACPVHYPDPSAIQPPSSSSNILDLRLCTDVLPHDHKLRKF